MKKLTMLCAALALSLGIVYAKPVNVGTAATVAKNFYKQNATVQNADLKLVYTETDQNGTPVYYIFNVNAQDGFVIVSAEDAIHPIIAYSTTGFYGRNPRAKNQNTFRQPDGYAYLMKQYSSAIKAVRAVKGEADADLVNEWDAYTNNHPEKMKKAFGAPASVAPLMLTFWDQDPYYDYDCPKSGADYCVTGCVATTMSQIMRYWAYPHIGKSSSSYSAGGTFGTLSADYATTEFNWQQMPLMLDTANSNVAKLISEAGISVQMSYAPTGSGAEVVGGKPSAQYSYVNYFGYNSSTLSAPSTTASTATYTSIEAELNAGRVVEYAGQDPSAGGHTWVCDGDNTSTTTPMFHMNWGWSGSCDAYFALSSLSPAGTGYDFSSDMQTLVGIEPPVAVARFNASQLTGCAGMSVSYTDQSLAPSSTVKPTAWSWSFPGGTPSTSTLQSPTGIVYNTPGSYNVTEVVTSSGGKDTVIKTNYITVVPAADALPFSEGFEGTTFPPAGWAVQQSAPNSYVNFGVYWQQNAVVGSFDKSKRCMDFNNLTLLPCVTGIHEKIFTPAMNFSSVASNATFGFDVAYTPYGTWSGAFLSDTLNVYYSVDCGATWTQIYTKGGMTLATADSLTSGQDSGTTVAIPSAQGGDTLGFFKPTMKQWRTETITLPAAVYGIADVMFAFENRSGNGDPIYVDNVTANGVAGPTSVASITNATSVKMFPNPNNGQFTVALQNVQEKWNLNVYNVLGQQVYTTSVYEGNNQVSVNTAAGMYFYRVVTESGHIAAEGKMIIE